MSSLTAAAVLAMAALPACGGGLGVPPWRMAALVEVESGGDPLAININGPGGGTRRPATKAEAVTQATALIAKGRSLDLGLTQINAANLARHGLTIAAAFDPCASLRAGTEHLIDDFWRAAHSAYNTGDPRRGIRNGYVGKIERALSRMPAVAPDPPAAAVPPPAPWDVWITPPAIDALEQLEAIAPEFP
ncbi:lytic transglycosylase domain-containing protein [Rhodovastum atsumiense]|uniref:lytic transglycosylase domain-containing protein n=2 Tax=Rhodovastum atsumiense TaxID=504468 RepID=UPI002024EABA|nr:lytic transglycosylase domain-containing protein [Rhodovastum atsumiense]